MTFVALFYQQKLSKKKRDTACILAKQTIETCHAQARLLSQYFFSKNWARTFGVTKWLHAWERASMKLINLSCPFIYQTLKKLGRLTVAGNIRINTGLSVEEINIWFRYLFGFDCHYLINRRPVFPSIFPMHLEISCLTSYFSSRRYIVCDVPPYCIWAKKNRCPS